MSINFKYSDLAPNHAQSVDFSKGVDVFRKADSGVPCRAVLAYNARTVAVQQGNASFLMDREVFLNEFVDRYGRRLRMNTRYLYEDDSPEDQAALRRAMHHG